jgi:copper transport protein
MNKLSIAVLAGLTCLALSLLFRHALPAAAHANYVRSLPEAGSANPDAPRSVQVWFSEQVDPNASSLDVRNASGATVDQGNSHSAPNDAASLIVTLKPLAPGTYTVIWQTLSAVDGHMAKGSFPFTVGQGHGTSNFVPLVAQMERNALALQVPPFADAALRWVTLLALVLVAGGFVYAPFAMPIPEPVRLAVKRRRLLGGALGLLAITLITGILLRGVETGFAGISSGRFGLVMLVRAALIALLAFLLWRRRDTTRLIALPDALLLLSQSMLSHSAAETDWLLPTLADWLHLCAAAIWLGGVTMLALIVAPATRTDIKTLHNAIARFSPLALGCVIVVYLTGIAQGIGMLGSADALLLTAYGRVLLAKIILAFILVGFGAFHQRYIAPRIGASEDKAAGRFRASIVAEALAGLLILAAAGVLTSLPRGRDVAPDPALHVNLITRQADDLQATLGVTPFGVGNNQFAIRLVDANGTPISGVQKVMLRFNNLSMDMGESELTLEPYEGAYYTAESSVISMDGWWQTALIVRRQGKADARTTYTYLISY